MEYTSVSRIQEPHLIHIANPNLQILTITFLEFENNTLGAYDRIHLYFLKELTRVMEFYNKMQHYPTVCRRIDVNDYFFCRYVLICRKR